MTGNMFYILVMSGIYWYISSIAIEDCINKHTVLKNKTNYPIYWVFSYFQDFH